MTSALAPVDLLLNALGSEEMGFYDIVVSLKSSDVKLNYKAHQLIATKMDYPLHIGITEAGTIEGGKVKSAIGIGSLLLAGIGDTIRVSLTGDPIEEVNFAQEILKALDLRESTINLVSCPTCGRCGVDLGKIASEVENSLKGLEKELKKKKLPSITVAVMGCAVNGPGEAKAVDFGIACGKGKGLIFKKGEIIQNVEEEDIAQELIKYIQEEVKLV